MIKKISVSEEVVKQLLKTKKCVEGALAIDKETGSLIFKAWNRKSPKYRKAKDILILTTEHGWVKESTERIKLYESVPKGLGASRVCSILEREMKDVKVSIKETISEY